MVKNTSLKSNPASDPPDMTVALHPPCGGCPFDDSFLREGPCLLGALSKHPTVDPEY